MRKVLVLHLVQVMHFKSLGCKAGLIANPEKLGAADLMKRENPAAGLRSCMKDMYASNLILLILSGGWHSASMECMSCSGSGPASAAVA